MVLEAITVGARTRVVTGSNRQRWESPLLQCAFANQAVAAVELEDGTFEPTCVGSL